MFKLVFVLGLIIFIIYLATCCFSQQPIQDIHGTLFALNDTEVTIYGPLSTKKLDECNLYFNTTHAYIDCSPINLCFPHDSQSLDIIKKHKK